MKRNDEAPTPGDSPDHLDWSGRLGAWFARVVDRGYLIAILALVAVSALAIYGLSQVTFQDNLREVFRSDSDTMAKLERLYQQFGSDDNTAFVVLESEDMFAEQSVAALRKLENQLSAAEQIVSLWSIGDIVIFPQARVTVDMAETTEATPGIPMPQPLLPLPDASEEERAAKRTRALNHPLVAGRLLSSDAQHALLIVQISRDLDGVSDLRPVVNSIQNHVRAIEKEYPVTGTVTGIPAARVELIDVTKREQIIFVLGAALICIGIAAATLRNLRATVVVAVASTLAPLWTIGMFGVAGVQVNPMNAVVPAIVLILVVAHAVHITNAFGEQLQKQPSPRVATRQAMAKVAPACVLTTLTTAIGFLSLLIGRVDAIEEFGVVAAIGVTLGLICVLTVTAVAYARFFNARSGAPGFTSDSTKVGEFLERVGAFAVRRRLPIVTAAVPLTIACVVACAYLVPTSMFRLVLPEGSPALQGIKTIDEELGGTLSILGVVEWDAGSQVTDPDVRAAIDALEDVFADADLAHSPTSIYSLTRILPFELNDGALLNRLLDMMPAKLRERFVRRDLRRAVVTAGVPDIGSHRHLDLIEEVRPRIEAIDQAHPNLSVRLSGHPVVIGENTAKLTNDLAASLASAGVIILLVVGLSFLSWRLALASIVPNALPVAAAGAFVVLTGQLLTVTGLITLCVVLGIAVDDTIHMVRRYRLERKANYTQIDAIRRATGAVGVAVSLTSLILLGGFSILLFSALPVLRTFGQLACVGLLVALPADLLILPALLRFCTRPASAPDETALDRSSRAQEAPL